MELHLEKVPCIRLDHMTDDQRRDYAIRHNRTAELSMWDFETLEEEIAQLEIEEHDFEGLKFTFDSVPPIPENLDGDDYDPQRAIAIKITFSSYDEYTEHEDEVKQFAESIGADYSVVKG